jgi:hypothetical protein
LKFLEGNIGEKTLGLAMALSMQLEKPNPQKEKKG